MCKVCVCRNLILKTIFYPVSFITVACHQNSLRGRGRGEGRDERRKGGDKEERGRERGREDKERAKMRTSVPCKKILKFLGN